MLKILEARWQQKFRTIPFPSEKPALPDRFRGLPEIEREKCPEGCCQCVENCPTGALSRQGREVRMDLGKCLFCAHCAAHCPANAISFSRDYRLAVRGREDLIYDGRPLKLAGALEKKMLKLFGRSLRLRQVSAGGCNACEADTHVLTTVVFDLSRFGVQFVASPRHADGLLITGPVPQNMKLALQKTYAALADPKIVIAVGACAIAGGPYIDHPEVNNGANRVVPVDLYIPGCPPHPLTILDGLLRLLNRLDD